MTYTLTTLRGHLVYMDQLHLTGTEDMCRTELLTLIDMHLKALAFLKVTSIPMSIFTVLVSDNTIRVLRKFEADLHKLVIHACVECKAHDVYFKNSNVGSVDLEVCL